MRKFVSQVPNPCLDARPAIRPEAGLLCVAIAVCCLAAGCSQDSGPQTFPLKGKVLFEGVPVTNGTVRYAPTDAAKGRMALGKIGKEGEFTLSTFKSGDGVLPGAYSISITAFIIPEDATQQQIEKEYFNEPAIPKKYFDTKTSGLNDSVGESHSGYT